MNLRMLLLLPLSVSLHCLADTSIKLDSTHPGPVIHPEVYGQFMEHLGRGVYGGVWVGEDSAIPNVRGIRSDVVEALRKLHVPVVRWPGGCFADEYHWRDGIGPRDSRKVTVNTNWGGVTDDNAFGTHEFFDFAAQIGAKVYINGNLGTGSPREMAAWLEYMTSDSRSTLAQERRKNGRDTPWKVDYFALGNEAWGCGGNMRPGYYTDLYRHFVSFLKTPADNTPQFIASGGNTGLTEWTDTLVRHREGVPMDGIAHHYYTLPSGSWDGAKGAALGFTEDAWFSTLQQTLCLDGFIHDNVAILDRYDPGKQVGFFVDEWGTWYDPAPDARGVLYQQNSLRDAVVAALNFNVFHKYASRVRMANIAQMVNVLQAMILTDGDQMVLTPTYHAFAMYVPFQGATRIPLQQSGNARYRRRGGSIAKISATAAIGTDGKRYLALVNTDPDKSERLSVHGVVPVKAAHGRQLTAGRMDAHNDFDTPDAVAPIDVDYSTGNGVLQLELPPKSVTVLALD